MLKIAVFKGRRKTGTVQLLAGEMLIGRQLDCELLLDDPLVSRHHARLMVEGDHVQIVDLGGAGGLTVNSRPTEQARLLAGDRVEIGPFTLVLMSEETGVGTSLDVQTVADWVAPTHADEATVHMSAKELTSLREHQRALLGAHLAVRQDGGTVEHPMTDRTQTIGFDEDCEVRLEGSALFVKRLAQIAPDGRGWAVVAISSFAPVKVNGERVERHALRDGDMIEVRGVTLRFRGAVGGR